MGVVIVVLAIIGLLVMFAYLKFPPPYANPKLVNVFDMMVLGVCAFLCLIWALNIRTTWMGTINDRWWQPVAIAGALGIEIAFLGICFLLRNFWVFKPPRRPGGL
jgi:hypothetical protein